MGAMAERLKREGTYPPPLLCMRAGDIGAVGYSVAPMQAMAAGTHAYVAGGAFGSMQEYATSPGATLRASDTHHQNAVTAAVAKALAAVAGLPGHGPRPGMVASGPASARSSMQYGGRAGSAERPAPHRSGKSLRRMLGAVMGCSRPVAD